MFLISHNYFLNRKIAYLLLIIIFSTCFISCKKKGCTDPLATNYDPEAKKDNETCIYEAFDKQAMLENITNNYILPALGNYKTQCESLNNSSNTFISNPDQQNLNNLRSTWMLALLSWQEVSFLDFGPSEYIILKSQTNIYPTDTALINNNINAGNWNFSNSNYFDQKGFQALDYLLNKPNYTEQELIDYFTNNINAKNYLTDITQDILDNINYVNSEWNGSYKTTFINNNESTAQGSSVSNMVNALCLHYEFYVRRGKIGLPLGVFNGFSQLEMPELVECYYYGQSLPFATKAISGLKKFINGINYTTEHDGQGLDDYMDFTNAMYNNNLLSVTINNQLNEISTSLNLLNDPLSQEITTNKSSVSATYQKMQQLVPYIKVDMTSALGILITYQDNDGD
jgi:hypothetical protein